MFDRRDREEIEKLLRQNLEVNEGILRALWRIEQTLAHPPQHFTIQLKEFSMAIGNINAGSTGQVGTALLDNGSPYVAPSGTTYTFTPTLTSSDAQVTIAPATTDASGGSVPLADQFLISVAAGDPGTSVTLTASATAPDGTTATGTLAITLTPAPQTFTIAVTQLA